MCIPFLTITMDGASGAHDETTQYIITNVIHYTSLLFRRRWPQILLLYSNVSGPLYICGAHRVHRLRYLLHGPCAACLRIVDCDGVSKSKISSIFQILLNKLHVFRYRYKNAINDLSFNTKDSEKKAKETYERVRFSIQAHQRAIMSVHIKQRIQML